MDDSDEVRSEAWYRRAELLLPAVTVAVYLVATSYFRAYVRSFGADPDWFEPSLLRLLMFGQSSLIGATFLFAAWLMIGLANTWSFRRWAMAYAMWMAIGLTYVWMDHTSRTALNPGLSVPWYLVASVPLVWIVAPIFWRWRTSRLAAGVAKPLALTKSRGFVYLFAPLFAVMVFLEFVAGLARYRASRDIAEASRPFVDLLPERVLLFTDGEASLALVPVDGALQIQYQCDEMLLRMHIGGESAYRRKRAGEDYERALSVYRSILESPVAGEAALARAELGLVYARLLVRCRRATRRPQSLLELLSVEDRSDHWGQPIAFQIDDNRLETLRLISPGPDENPGTSDDIIVGK